MRRNRKKRIFFTGNPLTYLLIFALSISTVIDDVPACYWAQPASNAALALRTVNSQSDDHSLAQHAHLDVIQSDHLVEVAFLSFIDAIFEKGGKASVFACLPSAPSRASPAFFLISANYI